MTDKLYGLTPEERRKSTGAERNFEGDRGRREGFTEIFRRTLKNNMRLIKFKIENFKSIINSNECELASDITILAGKNEAGKTIVLQALERFNTDDKFIEDDKPIDNKKDEPEMSLTFAIDKNDLDSFLENVQIPRGFNKDAILKIPFSVTKLFDNSYYFNGPNGSIIDFLLNSFNRKKEGFIREINSQWGDIKRIFQANTVNDYPLADMTNIDFKNLSDLRIKFLPSTSQFTSRVKPEDQNKLQSYLNEINEKLIAVDQTRIEQEKNEKKILDLLPSFVVFDAFDKEEFLPFDPITLEDAEKNQAVKNYFTLAEVDIDKLKQLRDARDNYNLTQYLKSKSYVIEEDFKGYWKGQDKLDLRLELAIENKIVFYFYEKRRKRPLPFKLNQRSKGLQWFLSFYLTVAAECKKYRSVVLIDEPGLFVHAKAQEDILDILKDKSKENQIIFTTHSPYLIDPSRLDRIRLVVKDLQVVKNKWQITNRGSRIYHITKDVNIDKDSLTPIITAIGLDISRQLTIAGNNNIILEGPSDYFYLQAALKLWSTEFKEEIKKLGQYHLIPATGANNIPSITSILFGWTLNFVIFLDNDQKGAEIYDALIQRSPAKEEQIIYVSDKYPFNIEDLFSKGDFNKYILGKDSNYEATKLNSEVISDSQKIVFARQFFSQVVSEKLVLSPETKNNFLGPMKKAFDTLIKSRE